MKITDKNGAEVKGTFRFRHKHADISCTTKGNFAEVAIFLESGKNMGPLHSIAEAIQIVDALYMQSRINEFTI